MGFMYCHGSCINCGRAISFNPERVPSLRVAGVREPVCPPCFVEWNRIHRVSRGLDPVPMHPDAFEPLEVA
jgi:hypothetical protein